jgi:hypothetical protein
MKQENKRYIFWGIFFIFLELVVILKNSLLGRPDYYLWFCDFSPILFSIGFFLKKDQLLKGLVNIGLIAQNLYIFDIFFYVFFGYSPLGFSNEIAGYAAIGIFLSAFIHIFSVNTTLFLTYYKKPRLSSLIYSIIILFFMFLVTIFFTNPIENINYVFFPGPSLHIPYYTQLWIPISFIVLVIPTYLFQYLLYRIR